MAGHSIFHQFATGRPDDEGKAELIEMAGNDDCSGCDYVPRNALPEERGTIYIYKKSINSIFLKDSLSSYDRNV